MSRQNQGELGEQSGAIQKSWVFFLHIIDSEIKTR